MVGIAKGWKTQCDIKDKALCARDVFLTTNNSKLQYQFVNNKLLIGQNKMIMEK